MAVKVWIPKYSFDDFTFFIILVLNKVLRRMTGYLHDATRCKLLGRVVYWLYGQHPTNISKEMSTLISYIHHGSGLATRIERHRHL